MYLELFEEVDATKNYKDKDFIDIPAEFTWNSGKDSRCYNNTDIEKCSIRDIMIQVPVFNKHPNEYDAQKLLLYAISGNAPPKNIKLEEITIDDMKFLIHPCSFIRPIIENKQGLAILSPIYKAE